MFSGTTLLGHDFSTLYMAAKWKQNVKGPFAQFAEKVFCEYTELKFTQHRTDL